MVIHLDVGSLVLQLILSLLLCVLLIKTSIWFGKDSCVGVQKFHSKIVSRMGGLSIALSILFGLFLIKDNYVNEGYLGFFLMIAFSPVFIAGLIEDLTHKVKPQTRLCMAFISAIACIFITQVNIKYTGIAIIDYFISYPVISIILTTLIIVGFLNSINIIDGFNGLASGSILIMIIAITIICFIVNDYVLVRISLVLIVSNLAFILFNWPSGKIFLGDSGAYLLGIWLVELGILMQHRSSNISPLAPVLIGAYPMIETLFTIYRRKIMTRQSAFLPDALHLHTLLFKRLISKPAIFFSTEDLLNKQNSKVAIYIWGFVGVDCLISIIFFENTKILLLAIILSFIIYVIIYFSLLKFKDVEIKMSKTPCGL